MNHRKIASLFAVFMLAFVAANAQVQRTDTLKKALETTNRDTVAWAYGGTINIGINEGFLYNWPAGGELGSMTTNGVFSGYISRFYHRHIWSNNLDLNYSLFYAYSNNFVPRKIDDRIDFSSKYGYRLDTSRDFYLTGLFNFRSQFTKGYDYNAPEWDTFSTSKFMSPSYFTLATGIEYRQGTDLQIFLSPLAARITVAGLQYTTRRPEGAFGIENGETTRFELGAYFSGRYTWNINRNVTYKTRLDLYSNYLAKDKTDSLGAVVKKDNPGNVDVLWDNLLTFKISKFLNVALGATMVYDNDIPYEPTFIDETGATATKDEPGRGLGWIQLKQIFSLGVVYKF